MIVPEADGGMGMSLVLRECHSPAASRLLGEIASGKTETLANTPKNGSWLAADCDIELVDGTLNGGAWFAQDVRKVETLIVQA